LPQPSSPRSLANRTIELRALQSAQPPPRPTTIRSAGAGPGSRWLSIRFPRCGGRVETDTRSAYSMPAVTRRSMSGCSRALRPSLANRRPMWFSIAFSLRAETPSDLPVAPSGGDQVQHALLRRRQLGLSHRRRTKQSEAAASASMPQGAERHLLDHRRDVGWIGIGAAEQHAEARGVVEHELAQMLEVHCLGQQAQSASRSARKLLGLGDRVEIEAVEHQTTDVPGSSRLKRAEARRAREGLHGVGLEPLTLEQRSQPPCQAAGPRTPPRLARHLRRARGETPRSRSAMACKVALAHSPPPALATRRRPRNPCRSHAAFIH